MKVFGTGSVGPGLLVVASVLVSLDCKAAAERTRKHVDPEYLAGVARLNAAVLAHLANAPAPPADARIIAAELTSDTTLAWSRGTEPDLAGYEVVWRQTTAPTWQYARDVGNVQETTLLVSKDDWLFGVRAYDESGFRSPVAFPAVARQ